MSTYHQSDGRYGVFTKQSKQPERLFFHYATKPEAESSAQTWRDTGQVESVRVAALVVTVDEVPS